MIYKEFLMKIVGLITEYNPFHNGHLYHIQQAKRTTGADAVIVVMSGDYVQRGVPLNGYDIRCIAVYERRYCCSWHLVFGEINFVGNVVDFGCHGAFSFHSS